MLNKKEKNEVCELIANWEWIEGGSSSEASAYARCAEALKNQFRLTNDDSDLSFARAAKIQEIVQSIHSDARDEEWLFVLCDMLEENYENTIDLCEQDQKFEALMATIREKM